MRSGVGGSDAMETISAASAVIASVENHLPQASFRKRRRASCWNLYWCFGSHKNNQRIGHAVLVPETTFPEGDALPAEHLSQPSSITLPFLAPPSSPASFLTSEPPSAMQSPTGAFSLVSASANMYSPGGPASIFATGPYAHETQLVSPPVFSTFTTEPSTAPYTPPPESVHLTTSSSPEVPFARLLEPNLQNGECGQTYPLCQYEFHSYQLQPGSPVSHLISPCSGISGSGTASPLLDREFTNGHPFFLGTSTGNPPTLLNLDKILRRKWKSLQGSGERTPDASEVGPRDSRLLNRQDSDVSPLSDACDGSRMYNGVVDHRVSFEITAPEVVRSVENMPISLLKYATESGENVEQKVEEKPIKMTTDYLAGENSINSSEKGQAEGQNEHQHQKFRAITLGSAKEFNFDNVDEGNLGKPSTGPDWWANEKVYGEEGQPSKDWSFFPMTQTSIY